MAKSVNIRLDDGAYLVVEGAAKSAGVTVSAWVREAIQEHIKGHVQARMMDRMDERIYHISKDTAEMKKTLAAVKTILDQVEIE